MWNRWLRGKTVIGIVFVVGATACAPSLRHGVLTFFFDGVPEPGAEPEVGYPARPGRALGPSEDDLPAEPEVRRVVYSHPPYRENRCGSCHNKEDGQVHRSPEEGLCLTCHAELVRTPKFLHGPVAANACAFCHHHHASTYPKLLLDDPLTICFGCHEEDDLTTGAHHANRDTQPCLLCHDPHGGGERFFLKSGRP